MGTEMNRVIPHVDFKRHRSYGLLWLTYEKQWFGAVSVGAPASTMFHDDVDLKIRPGTRALRSIIHSERTSKDITSSIQGII